MIPTLGPYHLNIKEWESMGATAWAKNIIKRGFRLLWEESRPDLQRSPVLFPCDWSEERCRMLEEQVSQMLQKGAIEEVTKLSSPGFYSHLFMVPKSTGGSRPILNLSPLNRYLKPIKFHMESADSIRLAIQQGDWATSLDLKDAYYHIPIAPLDRKWLRFSCNGKVFQYKVLPFGLSLSPWVFTKMVREVIVFARTQGLRVHAYLDDWIVLARSKQECSDHLAILCDLTERLGFVINPDKSEFTPKQKFTFLGMSFDTVQWLVQPSLPRRVSLSMQIKTLLEAQTASARTLSSILGKMESCSRLLLLGRLHKRLFQRNFNTRFCQSRDKWDKTISLQPWFPVAVNQWLKKKWLSRPVPITQSLPVRTIFTDASKAGWGGHMGALTASGEWPTNLRQEHINRLELEAVFLTLRKFESEVPPGHIRIRSDNKTVVALINHQGGTHAPNLSIRAEEILIWAFRKNWQLSARHVAGSANVMADLLSRPEAIIQTEWTLDQGVLERVWEGWEKPLVDLFATKFSKRLPIYVSPVEDPEAWKIDAMEIDWRGLQAYAFPPLSLIGKVVEKARRERPHLILVAPYWPAKAWFPILLKLIHEPPVKLELESRHLFQPRTGIRHGNPKTLNLHLWRLCGSICEKESCLRTL